MKKYSAEAWGIASKYSDVLASETRDLAAQIDAALADVKRKHRRHKLPPGECKTCDRERWLSNEFHPSHDATERCKSGKHNHCSCDTCF